MSFITVQAFMIMSLLLSPLITSFLVLPRPLPDSPGTAPPKLPTNAVSVTKCEMREC